MFDVVLMNRVMGMPMMTLQGGPTELFLPAAEIAERGTGMWIWFGWAAVAIVLVGTVLWVRAMNQQRIDPRELAFRALVKKLGLSSTQVSSIRMLADSSGSHAVGLLMSPSAVRSAAGN